jgi:large subunit ribosomal protein L21
MYAIVEIAGQQFKVEKGRKIFVHRLDAETGSDVEFEKVLLIDDDGKITIGEPFITDFVVDGHILDHVRGDKVIVFKKKRKKGYRVKNGHRQNFTQVEILSIAPKGFPKKVVKKVEQKVDALEETVEVKNDSKKATTAAEKKLAATKKTAEKKPAKSKKEE